MSVLVVQVGQCGNQLGESLWKALSPSSSSSSSSSKGGATNPADTRSHVIDRGGSPYFTMSDGKARCVLVDSEPKVVEGIMNRNKSLFRAENAVVGSSGRGNNWGAGYHGLAKPPAASGADSPNRGFKVLEKDQRKEDDSLLIRAVRAVHRETCRVEDGMLEAIVVIHSLAGGTGSGFGCHLAQVLRTHFIETATPEEEEEEEDIGRHSGSTRDVDIGGSSPFSSKEHDQDSPDQEPEVDAWITGLRGGPDPPVKKPPTAAPQQQTQSSNPPRASPSTTTARKQRHSRPQRGGKGLVDMEEVLAGEYGSGCKANYLFSVAVAPSAAGETAVQGYNLALTLDCLNPVVDGTILLRNDFTKFRGFQETNEFFAQKLLLPLLKEHGSIGDLVSNLCPDGTDNRILTVLPLDLKQYTQFHGSAHRCRTYFTKANQTPTFDISKLLYHPPADQQRRRLAARGHFSTMESHQLDDHRRMQAGGALPEESLLPLCIRTTETMVTPPKGGSPYVSGGGVLVLNQTVELQRFLFPFLKDCALKLQAGAFLNQYAKTGVSKEYVEKAVSNVVRLLLGAELD